MTKSLPLTARQVTAICKGAAKAGFIAEVKIGNAIVRLLPERFAHEQQDEEEEEIRL